jgi:hypothetical protein
MRKLRRKLSVVNMHPGFKEKNNRVFFMFFARKEEPEKETSKVNIKTAFLYMAGERKRERGTNKGREQRERWKEL